MASSAKPTAGASATRIEGVRLAAAACGSRYQDRDDLVLIEIGEDCTTHSVYTTNRFCAAPITVCKRHQKQAQPRYLIINAGNANAGTGTAGEQQALAVCRGVAELGGCPEEAVLPFSTGVIGEQLDASVLIDALPSLFDNLSPTSWESAAAGILTTDTRLKLRSTSVDLDGRPIHVTGIAKGSGMIKPNMATMLAYVATDARVDPAAMADMVRRAADRSFNCITVDGDTSTNDALVVIATGAAGNAVPEIGSAAFETIYAAIEAVCIELAKDIVRDGEGATKFVSVSVRGGRDEQACRKVAYTVAESPLVKTAMFASDPNWGRILAAIGRSPDVEFELADIDIDIGGHQVIKRGQPAPGYDETVAASLMQNKEIDIAIAIGNTPLQATVWTCDFSYDYVRINAEYRS